MLKIQLTPNLVVSSFQFITFSLSSGRLYPIVHHVARFDAVRPLCLSEYHVEDVMVLKCPFSRVMTQSDGVLIVFISREGAISSRNNKA